MGGCAAYESGGQLVKPDFRSHWLSSEFSLDSESKLAQSVAIAVARWLQHRTSSKPQNVHQGGSKMDDGVYLLSFGPPG